MQVQTLESWLWEAACVIRGPIDAPKFKDYILPLVFLKRLSDVFDDELAELGPTARFVDQDHSLVRFYIPPSARWSELQRKTTGLGQALTDAVRDVARHNDRLQGVINTVDFNATTAGQRILSDEQLRALIAALSRQRLGLKDVEPDIIGRAYEYLLKKFAEGSGRSAGERYTPTEVAILMARILDPQPGDEICDPCCGSGGLLIKCQLRFRERHGDDPRIAPIRLYGQDIGPDAFAMARMNAVLHEMDADIRLGDSMNRPAHLEADGSLKRFDIVTANPMWNQKFAPTVYEQDAYGRFGRGHAPGASADWAWVQHMFASLKNDGKLAVVLDTGAVSRGSGNAGSNKERDIRKRFVDEDLVEAVLLLPENLFYNTSAPGIILVVNRAKAHPGEILLINASKRFAKGRPKNYLTDEDITLLADLYANWSPAEGVSRVITTDEAVRNDYNLSPSRYVSVNGVDDVLSLEEALVELAEAEEERREADGQLLRVLKALELPVTW
jgi:type I restriction enzyme M protein